MASWKISHDFDSVCPGSGSPLLKANPGHGHMKKQQEDKCDESSKIHLFTVSAAGLPTYFLSNLEWVPRAE
jgi:hypothetical protein